MKRLLVIILALPFVAGAAGDAGKDWKPFHSKEGGYDVLVPGIPLESIQIAKTGLGTLELKMLLVELKKENAAFVVSFADFPEGAFKGADDEKRLNFARNGAVTSAKGRLKAEKKIALGKYPGRELLIENDKGAVRTRVYAVEMRLYQTVVSGSKAFVHSKDAERFLDSFKLSK
ncbi:MAG: hypothetical protein U0793_15450 [Gemmataceae bacterium]